jgi:hypothetical protein
MYYAQKALQITKIQWRILHNGNFTNFLLCMLSLEQAMKAQGGVEV